MRRKFIVLFIIFSLAGAAQVKFWQKEKAEDFLKGKLLGVSLSPDGILIPAPLRKALPVIKEEFIFAVAERNSREVFVATGHEGKLYSIDLAKGKATLLYDAPEMDIFTLTVADNGDVYFATSPKGKIYRYRKGKVSVFFDPEEKFIWKIKWHKGYLWVATGKNAVFYRVSPAGEADRLFEVEDSHIMDFVFSGQSIVLTTARKGRLYLYSGKKLSLLWESPWEEISGLAVYKNKIYVAGGYTAVAAVRPKKEEKKETKASVSVQVTYVGVVGQVKPAVKHVQPAAVRPSRPTLYAIDFSGNAEPVWTCPESYITALATYKGKLYIATGKKARIYRYERKQRAVLLFEQEAEEIRFLYPASNLYFATSLPASSFYMTDFSLEKGEYLSEVLDTGAQSRWGRIFFEGSGVAVYTRSGNSSKPDGTWSSWSPPVNTSGEKIYSPAARFLQFKIELTKGGKLESVRISYLSRNRPPVIKKLVVHPPHLVYKSYSEAEIKGLPYEFKNTKTKHRYIVTVVGGEEERKGFQTISWEAYDPDGDKLLFEIYIVNLKTKEEVLMEKNWADNYYVFDTSFFPDGKYAVKLVAKDTPSNRKEDALRAEYVSKSFFIDNTPPVIKVVSKTRQGTNVKLRVEVVDNQSYIKELRYSTDAKNWRLVLPVDGLADSKREIYEIVLPAKAKITLRAIDALKNTATLPVQ